MRSIHKERLLAVTASKASFCITIGFICSICIIILKSSVQASEYYHRGQDGWPRKAWLAGTLLRGAARVEYIETGHMKAYCMIRPGKTHRLLQESTELFHSFIDVQGSVQGLENTSKFIIVACLVMVPRR